MTLAAVLLMAVPLLIGLYAFVLYPALLRAIAARLPAPRRWDDPPEWPSITIVVPAYNEERLIGATLDGLLALDYPADRRQIIVVSDASTDRTDEIVRSYADRGVELVRQPVRAGKSAAENAVIPLARGEILVNTDATIRIRPDALRPLLRVFQDPTVGVASGRDVSVANVASDATAGEQGYVDYEMELRSLETRVGSIIGASGCFYAIRRGIANPDFPPELSRDFDSPLRSRLLGYRNVSVDEAVCLVPSSKSLKTEARRKARTMARGLQTLWYNRALLNPGRYGAFAWMLLSHKLARWLVFLTLPLILVGLALLATRSAVFAVALVLGLAAVALGLLVPRLPDDVRLPRPLSTVAYVAVSCIAGFTAWMRALAGRRAAIWEPTRRV